LFIGKQWSDSENNNLSADCKQRLKYTLRKTEVDC
jgi:hypothetical protein